MSDFPGVSKRARITVTDDTLATPAPADPSVLQVTYGLVDDDTPTIKSYPADPEVVRDAAGVFHIDILCGVPGLWAVRAKATSGLVGVDEEKWLVHTSAFA